MSGRSDDDQEYKQEAHFFTEAPKPRSQSRSTKHLPSMLSSMKQQW